VTADQLDRLVRVRNAVLADDPVTPAELVDWQRQAEDMTWLVATCDSTDVGAGVGVVGWHAPPGTAYVEAWTLSTARGHGVGESLYRELIRWSAERGCVAVETGVAEDDEASLAWADRRGFREVGRNSRLVLDLETAETPAVAPPEGIEIVPWAERPGIDDQLYDVYVEAEPDIPGEEQNELPSMESWLENDMRGLADRPEAVFVALSGDEVVGFAKLSLLSGATDAAYHDLTGVKRAWRGRGIAGALKRAQIAWAKEQGFQRLVTQNEARNEPIRRLNERHGYVVAPGRVVLRTAISSID
jgi:RimJ/RimL family protein N-acetyltransferase